LTAAAGRSGRSGRGARPACIERGFLTGKNRVSLPVREQRKSTLFKNYSQMGFGDMKRCFILSLLAIGGIFAGVASAAGVTPVSEQYGDWSVLSGEGPPDRYIAITTASDGEGYLVYSCHVKSACFLTMLVTSNCSVGSSYPMLMNSDSGAAAVFTTCIEIHDDLGSAEFSFDDPDTTLAETVFSDQRIGIAIPLADGKFTAVRFSLAGSDEAMARVITLANSGSGGKAVESGEF
jgi:hypothetical protein